MLVHLNMPSRTPSSERVECTRVPMMRHHRRGGPALKQRRVPVAQHACASVTSHQRDKSMKTRRRAGSVLRGMRKVHGNQTSPTESHEGDGRQPRAEIAVPVVRHAQSQRHQCPAGGRPPAPVRNGLKIKQRSLQQGMSDALRSPALVPRLPMSIYPRQAPEFVVLLLSREESPVCVLRQ